MKFSTDLLIAIVAALFHVGEISSFPSTVTKKALPVKTASTDGTTTLKSSTTDPADNKGYIRIALDDPQVKELTDYATEEVRLHQQSTDLSLKGIAFVLKQISTASRTNNYKLTLVLTKTGEKPSQSLLCNVNILLGESANERQSKTNCIRANIVSGIQSISSNGTTLQEDADLAAAIFATTEFNRQNNNSSSSLILLHYIASGSLEMISGMEYKLHMQMQGSAKDDLMCDANILPRTPRILHGVECGAMSSVHAEKDVAGSYNTADVKDTDVKETAEFAANALTERQIIESSTDSVSDRLSLVKVAKAWKKPVRGIQRRLRMTLSNDGEGVNEPSSYCLAVIFEDRLSGEYELVNGPGNTNTVCSSTPPTA
jgi:hypothetical protein